MKTSATIRACFVSYMVQAIVNNFLPLLFLTLELQYHIPIEQITVLIMVNFAIQLTVDMTSVWFVDRIGYRAAVILAHLMAGMGLLCLGILPNLLSNAYLGVCIAVAMYAVGGGLLEVVVSPIVEACPTEHKSATMSLLHSFYCWGQVLVVLLSTLFFAGFGIRNWAMLSCIWAVVPLANMIPFFFVPLYRLEGEVAGSKKGSLLRNPMFWLMFGMMLAAGAAELGMSQWASAYAERGLGISKTMGDLCGPMFFAILMGLARVVYATLGKRIRLERFIAGSLFLCVFAYLLAGLSPIPELGLLACGLCGFSVGVLWPGTYSNAIARIPNGGTRLFALLAFAGDMGCITGPTLIGLIAGAGQTGAEGMGLQRGMLCSAIFPVVMLLLLFLSQRKCPGTGTGAQKEESVDHGTDRNRH